MRVYVPLTLPGLSAALATGSIGPVPLTAYAVTPALREWYAGGDDEELEYAALTQAARASLALLAQSDSSADDATSAADAGPAADAGSAGDVASAGEAASVGDAGSGGDAAGFGGTVPRRVVAACEVTALPPAGAAAEPGDATVSLAAPVPWSAVAAVHVDAIDAEDVVAEALTVWGAAQNGDDDASFAVEACDGEELLWYATQEVPDLLAGFDLGTDDLGTGTGTDTGTDTGTAGREQRS
jgi:hypothetical protein